MGHGEAQAAYPYISSIYYTRREISSANMGFGSANIERCYTAQQLIAQLWSARSEPTVKRGRINSGKLIISLIHFVVE